VDIQQRIANLRAWRVKVEAPVYAVTWSLGWIPMVLMAMAWSGVDPQVAAPSLIDYLMLSGFVSVGLVAAAAWVARRFDRRHWLENGLAGGSVRKAESVLGQIARFREE
jgi:hypothetical protein